MFTAEQIKELQAKLDSRHVRQRKQAGRELSYIEGWHAIAEANRIFGFGYWDRETVELRQLFEPIQGKDRNGNDQWRVGYVARVKITVYPPRPLAENEWCRVVREGTGYGSGIAKDLGDAHESAIKEAETDAMKRALMTFGNPFGLALYDKEQANVETNSNGKAPDPRAYEHDLAERLVKASSEAELDLIWRAEGATIKAFDRPTFERIVSMFKDRKAEIQARSENTVLAAG